MVNKLGVNEYKLMSIEKSIVNQKLNLLDETFTFNKNTFDLEYLIRLNIFLLGDFYYGRDFGLRVLSKEDIYLINEILNEITNICIINPNDIKGILNRVRDIWYLQPFIVGNTRTMIAYLKIISMCFELDFEVDVNNNIENSPSIFQECVVVNQKRLTK